MWANGIVQAISNTVAYEGQLEMRRCVCASYVISLTSKLWFVLVNQRLIVLLKQVRNALEPPCDALGQGTSSM